jgi:leucine dehydrogenase
MTYKSALAGLNLGGGKSVIIGRVRDIGNEAAFRAFGRLVDSLGGRYVAAEDVNTTPQMMEWVHEETDYVAGLSADLGGSGDPSPFTAYGTFVGIKASAKKAWGSDSLEGKTIGVQGLGHVGIYLVEHLSGAGAKVIVTDIKEERVKEMLKFKNVSAIDPDAFYDAEMDIYAPCALGSTVNDETIDRLKCQIVAGAANNVLSDYDKHGQILLDRGVLYAPDYAINSGGVINVYGEFEGYNEKRSYNRVNHIYDILMEIFERSQDQKIPTMDAADALAEERIRKVGRLKQMQRSGKRLFSKI